MKKINFFAALFCTALIFAACEKNDEPKNDTQKAVDLGLSVKWATCNVGATKPEEYGNYYAWGETTTKDYYYWDTYKYYDSDSNKLTKYNTDSDDGTVDNKTTLEAADDAATANWGGEWRMPTDGEWTELRENCEWIWTDSYQTTGVAGYWVTGKNGNSIFLPAAGCRYYDILDDAGNYGRYWSSSLYASSPNGAWDASFNSDHVGRGSSNRYCGQSVRPVRK